jgi:outer membrane beta-barrel protein
MRLIGIVVLTFIFTLPARAGENDLYDFLWLDPDKSVYVLQNKIYPKNKSLYLDLGYVMGLSSDFQDTSGSQLRMGYFFSEEWAIELSHMQYSNFDNSAYDSIKAVSGTEPFVRRFTRSTSAYLIWSPFYGKINTFNKIYYFDWSFGVGSGEVMAESNIDSVRNPASANVFKGERYNPLQLKTSVKFHINKRVHLGMEFINSNYQAGSPKYPSRKEWEQNNDLVFTLGVSF